MAAEQRENAEVRWTTAAMAAFATASLEQATLEPGRSRWVALAFTAGVFLVPALAAAWVLARRERSPRRPTPNRDGLTAGPAVFAGLVGLFVLAFAWEGTRLVVLGRSEMAEMILLAALRNLGLGLAVLACRPVFARLSALVSLFLATVASSVGGEAGIAVLGPLAGFAVAGTFWLMLVYWKGLGLGTEGHARLRRPSVSGALWVLGVVGVLGAVAALVPSRAATVLAALVPTSGGTEWSDPDARSGVGDGDHEVAASEHPQSVGFTESEVYLETDRPSLYDAFNESYGEPLKPKTMDKMIAMAMQDIAQQKERPAENLQAGREFSAVRRRPDRGAKRPDEREASALVYVKGPTPLHLALVAYHHFDGRAWHEEPCCAQVFPAEPEPPGTWMRLPWSLSPVLAASVVHQVKIGALDSSAMPLPSHLLRFRVGSVNRLDFFGWAQMGIVRMTDRTVPAGTVIDSEARTVDPEELRSYPFPARPENEGDHFLSFQGEYAIEPAVAALARSLVVGMPEGWRQIEAVIDALRQGYVHDRLHTVSPDCTDVVAEFLLRSRRGPDYLFATSAAVLIRTLGYPVRVVSGLYAAPERYDPTTRHTPVSRGDIHFWAEVRLPDGIWVAIEPTPGYTLMGPARSWSRQLHAALLAVWHWAKSRWMALLVAFAALVVIWWQRRELLDRLVTLAWQLRGRRRAALCYANVAAP